MYEKAMLWALTGIVRWGRRSRTYLERETWGFRERERERERESRWDDVYSTALPKKVWGKKSDVKGALMRFDGNQIKKRKQE